MARRARKKKKGPKAVKVTMIQHTDAQGMVTEPYAIMERLIGECRPELAEAVIVLFWHEGWTADADEVLQLGACRKRTDIDRELSDCDFLIELNREAWRPMLPEKREQLVFHELMHAQLVFDENGDAKRDERSRLLCRVRKHDVMGFRFEYERYGLGSLSAYAQAAIADAERPLLKEAAERDRAESAAALAAADAALRTKADDPPTPTPGAPS